MTSSTSAAATPARSSAALIASAPSSWAGTLANAPLNVPTAVRAALAMTIVFGPVEAVILSSLKNHCQRERLKNALWQVLRLDFRHRPPIIKAVSGKPETAFKNRNLISANCGVRLIPSVREPDGRDTYRSSDRYD